MCCRQFMRHFYAKQFIMGRTNIVTMRFGELSALLYYYKFLFEIVWLGVCGALHHFLLFFSRLRLCGALGSQTHHLSIKYTL